MATAPVGGRGWFSVHDVAPSDAVGTTNPSGVGPPASLGAVVVTGGAPGSRARWALRRTSAEVGPGLSGSVAVGTSPST